MYVREGANQQYVTGASFLIAVHGDALAAANRTILCGNSQTFSSWHLLTFAKSQVSSTFLDSAIHYGNVVFESESIQLASEGLMAILQSSTMIALIQFGG